jgi:sterol desaturase/sphingolipid hydroxylase (fatty acid hydroxylase superfamily)
MIERFVADLEAWLAVGALGWFPPLGHLLVTWVDLLFSPLTQLGSVHAWWLVAIDMIVIAVFFHVVLRPRDPRYQGMGFLAFCFPRRVFTHPSTRTDLKLLFVNKAVTPLINVLWRLQTVFFAGLILQGMIALFGPPLQVFSWSPASAFLVALLIAFSEDLGFYLCHLAHHKIPVLWAFHKVHHSAEVMSPLTTSRNHPFEFVLIGPCKALTASLVLGPVLFLFGTPPSPVELFGIVLLSALFTFFGTHLNHSHIWLTWAPALQRVFVCPAQHQIHHSSAPRHHDKNMAGIFTFWDWVFGTLYIAPRQREDFRLGVHGLRETPHPGLVAAYTVPFIDVARALLPWLPAPLRSRCASWADALEARLGGAARPAAEQPAGAVG